MGTLQTWKKNEHLLMNIKKGDKKVNSNQKAAKIVGYCFYLQHFRR